MTQDRNRRFWNRIAQRYAARPLKDVPAYEAMLAATAACLSPSARVLELGCGTGGTAIRLAPQVAHWTATDFSAEMVRIASAKPRGTNLTFKVVDAANAFDDGPYDVVCAFNVLHLVDDLPGLLARAHANLRPGGVLISKTWCFAGVNPLLRALFRVLQVVRLFPDAAILSEAQLQQAIRGAGFDIVDQKVFGPHPQNPYIVARRSDGTADRR
ncbi:bifunctional 2-polyprenyl-6-hydroxyphenol methylase/3-demethylubiquinol 3-O-methyltransferase UbiG [Roseinatronobacter sp. S2]|uniref:class I SAM-dependent methyltransferase n=1 Tax=Roseinatronobacter sp. S2 TaxID=3035471 RepID=UPI00240F7BDF|nr:class I SAM-dependent methyltransferase [Roseinatronobacter sp. S2]WFE74932.1 class I SAM-dependent methyltransferase [Roseinatronobacter sp. S2]